jgi:hypothetical protein
MAEEAQNVIQPDAEPAPLVFEQPLNERMRTFLRLDFLYNQALYHNEMQSQWGSRAAMNSLLDILAIAARGAEGARAASCAAQRIPEQTGRRLRAVADRDEQPAAPARRPRGLRV